MTYPIHCFLEGYKCTQNIVIANYLALIAFLLIIIVFVLGVFVLPFKTYCKVVLEDEKGKE